MKKWGRSLVTAIHIDDKLNALESSGHTIFTVIPYHLWSATGVMEFMIIYFKEQKGGE